MPAGSVTPERTRIVSRPLSRPMMTSVSMLSPIITDSSECASIALSAERIISGFGLPTKYGFTPVALEISAATAPVAGMRPNSLGPATSGLVAIKRAPATTRRIALAMRSNEYEVVSPTTTYLGSASVSVYLPRAALW